MTPRAVGGPAMLALGALALTAPARAQDPGLTVSLKPGQAVAIPVTIADGVVKFGPARPAKPGAGEPNTGEILVAMVKNGLSPYAELTASEKTTQPVDFVATGLIGDIKIDEVKLCGRLDAPMTARIASGSWRVSLNRFAVLPEGQTCRP